MQRDEVFDLVRAHLAEELEVDPATIEEGTRFKQDLEADSLDLYELVMELEDRYGISVSEEQAARIESVGDAVSFVVEHAPA
jgi:acyl carrier protein